jgi:hypothetical protein
VREPGILRRAKFFWFGNWPFVFPLAALAVMFVLWYERGRDPQRAKPILAFEPPEGMTPAEVGTLADNSVDMRDVTATVVDLAVRGILVIEEEEQLLFGVWKGSDYGFSLKEGGPDWRAVEPHEREVLDGLFRDGARSSVKLSELENDFYRWMPNIRTRVFESLIARGYYRRRPDELRSFYRTLAVVVTVVGPLLGILAAQHLGMAPLPFALALATTGIIIGVFGWFMPARTIRGARAFEAVRGFEAFLRQDGAPAGSAPRPASLFERLLPYAIALGVEKSWAVAFQDLYSAPPGWYRGPNPSVFRTAYLVQRLSLMSSRAGSAMLSSPRSYGRSAGGGGMSGGGFGGGGGGGF